MRSAVAAQTELGKKAESYMNAGELVPDELILNLIRERLDQEDSANGWILDGFPRNVNQANFLDKLLEDVCQPCECLLNLEVPDNVLVSRLLARGRKDDNEEVIRNRLEVYRKQTEPLIEFFRNRQLLVSVNGHQPMNSVASDLEQVLQA